VKNLFYSTANDEITKWSYINGKIIQLYTVRE